VKTWSASPVPTARTRGGCAGASTVPAPPTWKPDVMDAHRDRPLDHPYAVLARALRSVSTCYDTASKSLIASICCTDSSGRKCE
jgi:hypothetical protein